MVRYAWFAVIGCSSAPVVTSAPPPVRPVPIATPTAVVVAPIVVDAAPPARACLPSGDARLAIDHGAVVLCSRPYRGDPDTERCATVTPAGLGAPVAVPAASVPAALTSATVRGQAISWSACTGTTCKPLGPNAVTAIRAAQLRVADEGGPEVDPQATEDLAVVVIAGEAWSLRADKQLRLKPPSGYAKPSEILGSHAEVMGRWLITSWTSCAGPCEKSIVADATGSNHGAMFDAGLLIRLDPRRAAVISAQQEQTITILDVASGKHLGAADLGAGEDFPHAVVLDDHAFVMVSDDFEVRWIDTTTNTPKVTAGPVVIEKCD